jgi:hypothetical protein
VDEGEDKQYDCVADGQMGMVHVELSGKGQACLTEKFQTLVVNVCGGNTRDSSVDAQVLAI